MCDGFPTTVSRSSPTRPRQEQAKAPQDYGARRKREKSGCGQRRAPDEPCRHVLVRRQLAYRVSRGVAPELSQHKSGIDGELVPAYERRAKATLDRRGQQLEGDRSGLHELQNGHAYVNVLDAPTCRIETYERPEPAHGLADFIVEHSRTAYGTPREDVEQYIREFYNDWYDDHPTAAPHIETDVEIG